MAKYFAQMMLVILLTIFLINGGACLGIYLEGREAGTQVGVSGASIPTTVVMPKGYPAIAFPLYVSGFKDGYGNARPHK